MTTIHLKRRPFLARFIGHCREYRRIEMTRIEALRWAWFLTTS